jgi:DNA/RNA-binding domain of Phe-tRNA-synthetase-like protein
MSPFFHVTEDCHCLGLRAGAVVFRGVRVGPPLREELAREAEAVRARFADVGAVRSSPEVVAFQALLRNVGVNPRRDQPSLERLLTFALKRSTLPAVNALVDAYNLVSVRRGLSLGAHDLDRVALPVTLQLFRGTESFTPLGRDAPEPVRPGEYGYVDAADRVLCRLDVLQAEFSKVLEWTTSALLIVEGTATHPPEALPQAMSEAAQLVTRYCGGTAQLVHASLST